MRTQVTLSQGNYEHLEGSLQGEDVYIVGSGVSLIGFDYSILKGKKIVPLNHACFKVPEIAFHVFLDTRFFNEANLVDKDGVKWDSMPWQKVTSSHSTLGTRDGLAVIKPSNYFNFDPKAGLYTSKNSACFGISTAIFARARRIYLLGIDCRFADKEEAMHIAKQNGDEAESERIRLSDRTLYGHSTSGTVAHSLDSKEHENIFRKFSELFDAFDGKAEIYNCSKWSRIKTFPLVEL